jgi:hypothetical protein
MTSTANLAVKSECCTKFENLLAGVGILLD